MTQQLRLLDSRGDVVLTASSRELDPTAEWWIDRTPKGWYGGYAMRGENTDRISHGGFPATRTRGTRSIEVAAHVHLDSWEAANAAKRRLSAALADGEAGQLWVSEGGVPELWTEVERTGDVLFARVAPATFKVSIPLTAPDPHLYGAEEVVFLHPQGTGIGLEFPTLGGDALRFGTAIATDDAITNTGNVEAWPTFLVVGDFPGGFRLTVDDRSVEWPWPTIHDAPIEIRMTGAIWIGSTNVTAQAALRQWSSIPAGGAISPTFMPLQGGDGWCEVHHHPTYM